MPLFVPPVLNAHLVSGERQQCKLTAAAPDLHCEMVASCMTFKPGATAAFINKLGEVFYCRCEPVFRHVTLLLPYLQLVCVLSGAFQEEDWHCCTFLHGPTSARGSQLCSTAVAAYPHQRQFGHGRPGSQDGGGRLHHCSSAGSGFHERERASYLG